MVSWRPPHDGTWTSGSLPPPVMQLEPRQVVAFTTRGEWSCYYMKAIFYNEALAYRLASKPPCGWSARCQALYNT